MGNVHRLPKIRYYKNTYKKLKTFDELLAFAEDVEKLYNNTPLDLEVVALHLDILIKMGDYGRARKVLDTYKSNTNDLCASLFFLEVIILIEEGNSAYALDVAEKILKRVDPETDKEFFNSILSIIAILSSNEFDMAKLLDAISLLEMHNENTDALDIISLHHTLEVSMEVCERVASYKKGKEVVEKNNYLQKLTEDLVSKYSCSIIPLFLQRWDEPVPSLEIKCIISSDSAFDEFTESINVNRNLDIDSVPGIFAMVSIERECSIV